MMGDEDGLRIPLTGFKAEDGADGGDDLFGALFWRNSDASLYSVCEDHSTFFLVRLEPFWDADTAKAAFGGVWRLSLGSNAPGRAS